MTSHLKTGIEKRWTAWPLVWLVVIFVAYEPAMNGGFVWDDDAWTTNIASLTNSWRGLWEMWSRPTALQQYFPLTGTTFWLDHQFWGEWTLPYHVENVLLHALSVWLFVRLLQKLRVPGAWLAGGMLALHPMMVESVAWIAERKNVLSMVLFLQALLSYGRAVSFWSGDAGPPWEKRGYWMALFWFLLALLAKASVFGLPAVLLLLVWWKLGRVSWRGDVLPALPFFAVALLMSGGVMWLEQHHVGAEGGDWDRSFVDRLGHAGQALSFYAGKLFWPVPLPPIHPQWKEMSLWSAWAWPSAVLIIVLMLRRRSWWRGLVTVLLFFVGMLLPVSGLFNVYGMLYAPVADRWVHLPSLGLFALLASVLTLAGDRWGKPWMVHAMAGVFLSWLGWLTWSQSHFYRDNETLMRTALRMNPDCWVAAYNLGNLMSGQPEHQTEALSLYHRTLRARPQHVKAHNNIGNLLFQLGHLKEAEEALRKAIEFMPALSVAHLNLGNCLWRQGRAEEAAACFQRALELSPDLVGARTGMAVMLYSQGKIAQAAEQFQRLVDARPESAEAHGNLAVALVHIGRLREGVSHYEAALRINPQHSDVLSNYAWLLATCPDDAVRDGARAVALAGKIEEQGRYSVDVQRTMAAALAESRQFDEAVAVAGRAARLAAQSGNEALANVIRQELDSYRSRFPKRDESLVETGR